ncbi:MAG TPA: tRNA (N6-threonylcarbamoyladenosine(37)-N6)-methyltransferase TrmO [Methanoregulaceae archaeon]|nr:tRNA (N6-threonylcarbamoyladenosine(37)-N6)-methyltransferase TrmO [Methanoregulaceae archaeon]
MNPNQIVHGGLHTFLFMPFDIILIGIVHSPYQTRTEAPHQGRFSETVSEIEIFDAYAEGLKDIEKHSHLIILSWFDRSDRTVLLATPPHSGIEHGVFATRSPERPNPVGLCVVELIGRKGTILKVRGLDSLDGTPVIDIKPYFRDLDCMTGKGTTGG